MQMRGKKFLSLSIASVVAVTVILFAFTGRQVVFAGANGALHASFFNITTQSVIDDISNESFMPGDEFRMTTGITGNTGFAAMIVRVYVPQGLELIGFDVYPQANFWAGFDGPENWDDDFDVSPPMTGNVFVGWNGRTVANGNFTGNGQLFTHTFRVSGNIGTLTAPLTMALANASAPFYEAPTDVHFTPLEISLPGGIAGVGRVADFGRVMIGTYGLSVVATPGHRTIAAVVGAHAEFNLSVSGMPANRTFCIAHPFCILNSNCPAYDYKYPGQTAGITIDGLPPFIAVAGAVRTNESGAGGGRLIMVILDNSTPFNFEFGGVTFYSVSSP